MTDLKPLAERQDLVGSRHQGSVVVMVGAGFSRGVAASVGPQQILPLWKDYAALLANARIQGSLQEVRYTGKSN